jgi:hypothetical protein
MADSGAVEQRLDRRDQDRVIGADDLVHAYILYPKSNHVAGAASRALAGAV